MGLGILSGQGGSLGAEAYFAPASTRAGIDLGPEVEWTPEGREYRQRFEEGFNAYLQHASHPLPPPVGQWETDPALLEYQQAMRETSSHAPWISEQLAMEAEILGHQADLRSGRNLMMHVRRPVHGLGQIWLTPAAPPGYSFSERATVGLPVWR